MIERRPRAASIIGQSYRPGPGAGFRCGRVRRSKRARQCRLATVRTLYVVRCALAATCCLLHGCILRAICLFIACCTVTQAELEGEEVFVEDETDLPLEFTDPGCVLSLPASQVPMQLGPFPLRLIPTSAHSRYAHAPTDPPLEFIELCCVLSLPASQLPSTAVVRARRFSLLRQPYCVRAPMVSEVSTRVRRVVR